MNNLIHRKERIIFTSIKVMNELGVHSLSTKKIAEYEGISESTVFKHFENKNTLLMSVLDFYAQYDSDIIESIEIKNLNGIDGIIYFIEAFTTYYENYPEITAINQGLDEMRYINDLSYKVEEIFKVRFNCLLRLIRKAKEEKSVKLEIEEELLADIIMGTVNGIIRRWRFENYEFNLKDRCIVATLSILKAYSHKFS